MNLQRATRVRARPPTGGRSGGFTLTETLVASAVLLMVFAAILIGNSFGMRMLGIIQPKLSAGAETKKLINQLRTDIHEAKFVRVGDGDLASFTPAPDGSPRAGAAIQIHPSSDTNVFVRYYRDAAGQALMRWTNGAAIAATMASGVGNAVVFTAEDPNGVILTNDQAGATIGVALDYFELGGSGTPVGTNDYFKAYSVMNKISWRAR